MIKPVLMAAAAVMLLTGSSGSFTRAPVVGADCRAPGACPAAQVALNVHAPLPPAYLPVDGFAGLFGMSR